MSDRPAGVKATRSPWTDGAWIMQEADAATLGWWSHRDPDDPWWPASPTRWSGDAIVEAVSPETLEAM
jgi:hypothetical protein